jgi:uncharacterized sporulation protein YeaH/YhbH (DUF444 family)
MVSSVLEEMKKQIEEKYDPADWNIYAAQASDGDNIPDDSPLCAKLLSDDILPVTQYFAYIEIKEGLARTLPYDTTTDLWKGYAEVKAKNFKMKKVNDKKDIYPVFHDLFSKERD